MFAVNVEPLLCSVASVTETGKILEDTTSSVPKITTVLSDPNINVFGAWTTHDASLAVDSWIASITAKKPLITGEHVIELGIGAAGSEVPIVRWSFASGEDVELTVVLPLPIPIKVPVGTRLSIRAADNKAGNNWHLFGVNYYQGLET